MLQSFYRSRRVDAIIEAYYFDSIIFQFTIVTRTYRAEKSEGTAYTDINQKWDVSLLHCLDLFTSSDTQMIYPNMLLLEAIRQ